MAKRSPWNNGEYAILHVAMSEMDVGVFSTVGWKSTKNYK